MSGVHPALREGRVKLVMALNTHNILTGERGVARVFGPQKGATPEQVEQLAHGFEHWARLLSRHCLPSAQGTDFAMAPARAPPVAWAPALPPWAPSWCHALPPCSTRVWPAST